MPRLLVTSRSDASSGGAGRVATELAEAARASAWEVRHLVRVQGTDANVECLPSLPGDVVVRNLVGWEASALPLLARSRAWRPDLVHVHDPVVAFGHRATRRLASRAPLVVTLHDFSGAAGGCLNPRTCTRASTGCGACPQLGDWPLRTPVDTTRSTWRANEMLASMPRVVAVAPSRWAADLASAAAWRRGRVEVIPNPVDTRTFRPPATKEYAGRSGPLTLLFVASQIHDARKGLHTLLGALAQRPALDVRVHVVGRGRAPSTDNRVRFLGPLRTKEALAHAYRDADLLVTPTTEDNLPCIVAESMACGTPVLAFATGGIPEMVTEGQTGWLVHDPSTAGLASALDRLPARADLRRVGSAAREHAARTWDPMVVAARYLALYDELCLGANKP